MIVMGGVIGSGIFVNPAVVARHIHSPVLILGAWVLGGALALMGAMIFAELGAIMPTVAFVQVRSFQKRDLLRATSRAANHTISPPNFNHVLAAVLGITVELHSI